MDAALLLDELNRRIEDSDAAIGPSYLMDERIYQRDDGLDRVWQYSIMPLLEDLFYGQRDLAERYGLREPPQGHRRRHPRRPAAVIPIELRRAGRPAEVPLTPEQGRSLAGSGVVSAVPSPYRLRDLAGWPGRKGRRGPGRRREVRIKPKVRIERLLFLARLFPARRHVAARDRAGCRG